MDHRTIGYSLLSGNGIEIGALHNPARLPDYCQVRYCDAMTEDDARRSFPELAESLLVHVDHLVNLDLGGLSNFADGSFDFVILNHVIEHVANPIQVIQECFRVLCSHGRLVLSVPDMRFTFDRSRQLTSFEHLWDEFEAGVQRVTDDHYTEFLRAVHPEVRVNSDHFRAALASVRDRREHAHVWGSDDFKKFVQNVLERLQVQAQPLLESMGDNNGAEYFSVWLKLPDNGDTVLDLLDVAQIRLSARYLAEQALAEAVQVRQQQMALSAGYEARLVHCQAELQKSQGQNHQQLNWIDEKNIHIRNIESLLAQQQSVNARLLGEKMALQQDLALSQRQTVDKDRHIDNVQAALNQANSTTNTLQNQLHALLASRSWRLTAPARWFVEKVRH